MIRIALIILCLSAISADAAFYLRPHGGVFGAVQLNCLLLDNNLADCLLLDSNTSDALLLN